MGGEDATPKSTEPKRRWYDVLLFVLIVVTAGTWWVLHLAPKFAIPWWGSAMSFAVVTGIVTKAVTFAFGKALEKVPIEMFAGQRRYTAVYGVVLGLLVILLLTTSSVYVEKGECKADSIVMRWRVNGRDWHEATLGGKQTVAGGPVFLLGGGTVTVEVREPSCYGTRWFPIQVVKPLRLTCGDQLKPAGRRIVRVLPDGALNVALLDPGAGPVKLHDVAVTVAGAPAGPLDYRRRPLVIGGLAAAVTCAIEAEAESARRAEFDRLLAGLPLDDAGRDRMRGVWAREALPVTSAELADGDVVRAVVTKADGTVIAEGDVTVGKDLKVYNLLLRRKP
jgi:hypothetical protein